MSERGTWITGRIHCPTCAQGFRQFLAETGARPLTAGEKYWSGGELAQGIFAGWITGLYDCEELHYWEGYLKEAVEKHLCHPVRIAVLAEGGEAIYYMGSFQALPRFIGRYIRLDRAEAEFLVDACEKDRIPQWMALAAEIRQAFGMGPA